MERAADFFSPWYPLFIGIVGAIIGAASMYFSLVNRINTVVELKLSDENYMNKLISNLRPYVIFDQNESVIIDAGAMEYIDSIKVNGVITDLSDGRKVKRPKEIIISPKKFLALEPSLQSYDEHYEIRQKRGQKFDIIYELVEGGVFMQESSQYRFRLEIIKL
jgi:hypothetical protein